MKQTRLMMGMPITVEIVEASATSGAFDRVYDFFTWVDETFSPFKETSEVSRLNRGELDLASASAEMQLIWELAEQTRQETQGYFNVWHAGRYDPSGIVKGWAIQGAAELLRDQGFRHFYVDAGGDAQLDGDNSQGVAWQVGIRNPFDSSKVVKTFALSDCGVATSGFYQRGPHIYNPHAVDDPLDQVVSVTVIGPNIYEADRFATAAFAMGQAGIYFIESLVGFEGYVIDRHGQATLTSGLGQLVPA